MLLGKTVIVTGVASGIGAATATLAQALGAEVIGIDRNEARGPLAGFVRGDLSSRAGVAAVVASLPDRLNAIEANLIREALEANRGDVRATLEMLGIPRKTFYDKLTRHGIDRAAYAITE